MPIFIGIAVLNGIINILNKMINLQAKLKLGTANGTLINYLEGTVISLLIIFLMGASKMTDFSYLRTIPTLYFFGGLFGLLSMVLILIGMAKNQISYSTIIVLIGQLGAGLLIDSIVTRKIVPIKIIGIVLVIMGVVIDKYLSRKSMKKAPA
jgi:bacterial/archaeal transporter family-2 protein